MTTPSDRLRELCLALPETAEKEAWGEPTYRVRGKMFAMEHRGKDGRSAVWCKAPPGSQEVLVGADPDRFFVPPYVGHKGWIGMWLDDGSDGSPVDSAPVDWTEVDTVVRRSYALIAPKKLAAQLAAMEKDDARDGQDR